MIDTYLFISRARLTFYKFSGMRSHDFREFPSIKEVECDGKSLKSEVKLLSLRLFRVNPESAVEESEALASLNVFEKTCMTFSEYSSCIINTQDTHSSRLRILVHDLREGETREYGCTANTMTSFGISDSESWEILVQGHICKLGIRCI